jgi:lipopolysaccharide export system protein LptA
MKRRVVLMLVTFLVLAMAVGAYQLLALGLETEVQEVVTPPAGDDLDVASSDSGLGPGSQTKIEARKDGRLQRVFEAESWKKNQDDGGYDLVKPRFRIFQPSGQEIVVTAERGKIFAEEIARGVHARRGSLYGNVRISMDRSRTPTTMPIEQRQAENVVRIEAEEFHFNNDLLEIKTSTEVSVYSAEADIHGRGLLLRWNESPRELRLLRLDEGRRMVIRDIGGRGGLIPMPGRVADEAGAGDGAAASTTSRPDASQPTTALAGDEARSGFYKATFNGDVNVASGDARLRNARTLSMVFAWDRDDDERLSDEGQGPGNEDAPPVVDSPLQPTAGEATSESATTVITWSGPVELVPAEAEALAGRDDYRLEARGEQIVLEDASDKAICRELVYLHPQQKGYLAGSADEPARMVLASGERISAETIRFDSGKGLAFLEGPGEMTRPRDEGASPALAAGGSAGESQPQSQPAGDDRITWRQSVLASFETVESGGETTNFIKRALFNGEVELTSGDDSIACEKLDVDFARERDSDGKAQSVLKRAVASGSVSGRQQGSEIAADEVTVEFARVKGDDGEASVEPVTMIASGNVKIVDRQSGQPVQASAQRIVSNVRAGTAELTGEPATIGQGVDELSGARILLHRDDGSARVVGRGQLTYLNDRDLNGGELAKAQTMTVSWRDGMDYNGQRGLAQFNGKVNVVSGSDNVHADKLSLVFHRSEKAGESRQESADQDDADGQSPQRLVRMADYGGQELVMILAEKDVVVASERHDEQKRLIRRIKLSGPQLVYDQRSAQMNVFGNGEMLVEDYLPPERGQGEDQESAKIERPHQTYFEWDKQMQLSQNERRVFLDGDVSMVHHSGQFVVGADELNVPDWGKLSGGRMTTLGCDKLMAEFDEPDEPARADAAAGDPWETGPRLGPLKLVSATGARDSLVTLKDGDWTVVGRRLVFDRVKDIAVIWGFLEGNAPADARISQRLSATRQRTTRSPKIVWHRRTDRVVAERVSGGAN